MLNFLNKCKFTRKNIAMTLAELLMVFAIMGVVASMTLYTARPGEKGLKYLYARIYDTIGTAFYNSSMALPKYLAIQNGTSAEGMDQNFPTTSENFCKMLLEYINFKAYSNGSDPNNVGGAIPEKQETNNFSVANCRADTISINQSSAELDQALNSTYPHFIASNGTKFWIGHTLEKNKFSTFRGYQTGVADANETFNMRYYVVFADLNGDARPNTTSVSDRRAGDIVAFIVTENHEVIPLGRAELDRRYLSARVVYNVTMDANSTEASTSSSMPYYQAKRIAWGTEPGYSNMYASADNAMSLNFYSIEGEDIRYTDLNQNITSASAFYLNYSDAEFNEFNNFVYDPDNCSMFNFDLNATVINPNACYIRVTDYY